MTVFTYDATDVFAGYDANGNARSPNNAQAQVLIKEIQRIVDAAVSGTAFMLYTTRAALYADLAHDANTAAVVLGDSTVGYDGLYVKSGASGSGSWARVGNVPGSGINRASNAGAGTATAIVATTTVPVSESQVITLPITDDNTGSPVTVAFNGGSALTIKTQEGDDVAIGALKSGSLVFGQITGSNFQLLNPEATEPILATNAGAGTANAIVATTTTAVGSGRIVILPIDTANTSSIVTVAFNGGTALNVKTQAGNNPAIGSLAADAWVTGIIDGSTFRLLSDLSSAAIQAAAEAAQAAAEAAAAVAIANSNDSQFLIHIGTIRNNGDQSNEYNYWKLIDDGTHDPLGFYNSVGTGSEIETTDSIIRVHHDIGAGAVGSFIAAVDETLAQTGIRLGTSVGVDYTDIHMYRDFMAQISRSAGGVWNHDPNNAETFTAAWNASGYLDITFPDTPSAIGIVQQVGGTEIGTWDAQFQQISATSARIHFFRKRPKKHTARIRWNSSFSVVAGSVNVTIGTFSGGLLPVTFTDGDVDGFDISVSSGGGINGIGYLPQIRNPSTTGFDLQWVDSSGAVVTTADNKMEAYVSATSSIVYEQPSNSTTFALRVLSRSTINPKSISTVEYAGGNIWLFGASVKP